MDLDDLMKRHARGERSPELLQALDRLAWEAFHAPWEAEPSGPVSTPEPMPAPGARADLLPWMTQTGQELLQRGWAVSLEYQLEAPRVVIRPDPDAPAQMILEATQLLVVPGPSVLTAAEAVRGWNQSRKGTWYPAALRPSGRRARHGLAPHSLGLTGRIRILDPLPDPDHVDPDDPGPGEALADTVLRFQIATEEVLQTVQAALGR